MGYFDGLTDALFKNKPDGSVVFYPWGALGKGYVVTPPQRATQLRSFVRRYYQLTVPLFILMGIVLKGKALWIAVPVLGILLPWYAVRTRQLLASMPRSAERFSISEGYARSAASMSVGTLRSFYSACVLVAIMGLVLMLIAHTRERQITGAIAVAGSGIVALLFRYMLSTRRH